MSMFRDPNVHSAQSRRILPSGSVLGIAVALLLAAGAQLSARAASPVPSLDIVPADVAFYSAMLRNREQFEAIVNSHAFAKIKALPYVQMGLGIYQVQAADPDSPAGKFAAALRDPEVKQSLKVLADLFSDEVFVYGGKSFYDTIELVQGTYGAVQLGPLSAIAAGKNRGTDMEKVQGGAFVQALVHQIDRIKFPDLVIGFRAKDPAAVKEQLDHLELNLQTAVGQIPLLEKRLKRKTVDGHSYLTLSLDGSMISWDPKVLEEIRSLAASPADGERLIAHLKKTTLVISLGLRDDYLLLAIGPSTDALTQLGKGARLGSLPQLAAVSKYGERRIYTVGYQSNTLNGHFSQSKSGIDDLLRLGKSYLPKLPGPEKLRADLAQDAERLAADIKSMIAEAGASSSLGFLTDSGSENYDYDWSEHPEADASKPLDLLKHIGGTPVAALVSRSKVSPQDYETLVRWIGVADRYLREYGVPQIPPKERPEFDRVYAQVKPLLARLDKATRNLLLPALADGQGGLVIDARFTSRQFLKALPATGRALPMIEPAIVVGVSDAALLKQAAEEYFAVADDFVEVLKGIEKSQVPKDFKLPRPKAFPVRQGTVYGYALPVEWGLDSRVLPNAALSEKVLALTLTGRHSLRLLSETEPKIAGLPLATDRPLSSVGGLDFAALIDALAPWVEFGLDKGAAQMEPQMAAMVRQHAKTALEVLKVYRGTVSETYLEGKVTVTRSRSEYRDVDE